MSVRLNVFEDEPWDMNAENMKIRGRFLAKPSGAQDLGATVYELLPGSTGFHLHAHYAMEEMFVVLSGTPTLRTGETEERLAPGDFVFCAKGSSACTRSRTRPTSLRGCSHGRPRRFRRWCFIQSSARCGW
jgi:uncharacterized cupin superfamily protein